MEDTILDEIEGKADAELFKELYRQLPLVCVEDYWNNGVWLNDLMRLDIQILAAHRTEAGAPDPPDISEIPEPIVPSVPKPVVARPQISTSSAPPLSLVRPQASAALARPPLIGPMLPRPVSQGASVVLPPSCGGLRPTLAAFHGLEAKAPPRAALTAKAPPRAALTAKAPPPKNALTAKVLEVPLRAVPTAKVIVPPCTEHSMMTFPTPAAMTALELEQLFLFVSQWRLDPFAAKTMLSKLAPRRRAFVMNNFQEAGVLNCSTPVARLEEFIRNVEYEEEGSWAVDKLKRSSDVASGMDDGLCFGMGLAACPGPGPGFGVGLAACPGLGPGFGVDDSFARQVRPRLTAPPVSKTAMASNNGIRSVMPAVKLPSRPMVKCMQVECL